MKKILIPSDVRGKDLFSFLMENKEALIAQKKSLPKFTTFDGLHYPTALLDSKGEFVETKAESFKVEMFNDPNTVPVKVVGNAMWWCDSQFDVLTTNCAKKTIQQRKSLIVHLKDHKYELEAQIGDVTDVYLEDISLRKLGLQKSGSTQCIIIESNVQREYNEKIFNKYKSGKVNQHSIGLNYVQIELAINDEEYEKEMDFWNKYYKDIINKEFVDEYGFFWVVNEIKLLEVSAVLFGANELTPTLEIGNSGKTAEKASIPEPAEAFDLDVAILTTKFFN
jgi:hypothetical protein